MDRRYFLKLLGFTGSGVVTGLQLNRLLKPEEVEKTDTRLENKIANAEAAESLSNSNYLNGISHMKFDTNEDVARLILYHNKAKLITPKQFRAVHDAYGRALESTTDDALKALAWMYQSSVLRNAASNVVLRGEVSDTSLFGRVQSDKPLNYQTRLLNLLRAFENYEQVERICKRISLPDNVGYGLAKLGETPSLDFVHERMIDTIDQITSIIGYDHAYSARLSLIATKRKELLSTLPPNQQDTFAVENLSTRLRYVYQMQGRK